MSNQKNIGIYLGRFQPLHIGHLNIILNGLKSFAYPHVKIR